MKYKKYPTYKDSGVEWLGEIPSEWETLPARSIVTNIMQKNENTKDKRYLSLMANIGVIRYEEKGDVGNKKPDDLSKCKVVSKGNLVINSMNYSIGSYGMSSYDGVCSPVYVVLGIKKDKLNSKFGLRLFENKTYQKYISSFGNGILAHRAAIGWDEIKGSYMPTPPLQEQQQIAKFLDSATQKIDILITKQEKLIELLKEKRQAVISHAVTKGLNPDVKFKDSGVEWLGDIPEHWVVGKLKHNLTLINQKVVIKKHRVIALENIESWSGKYVSTDSQYTGEDVAFKKGDVLFGKLRPYLAKVFKCTFNGVAFGDLLVFRPNKNTDTIYSYYYMISEDFIKIVDSSTYGAKMPRASADFIQNMNMPILSINEQQEIATFLDNKTSKIDTLIEKSKQSIKLLKEKRTALISAAVTGKIDVREMV